MRVYALIDNQETKIFSNLESLSMSYTRPQPESSSSDAGTSTYRCLLSISLSLCHSLSLSQSYNKKRHGIVCRTPPTSSQPPPSSSSNADLLLVAVNLRLDNRDHSGPNKISPSTAQGCGISSLRNAPLFSM